MLHSHCQTHFFSPNYPVPLSFAHDPSKSLNFLHKPTILHSVSVSALPPWSSSCLVQLAELTTLTDEGPIELPLSTPFIFATTQEASPIQVAATVLLTGAITVFLFRSVRRRIKRAKELKFRSSGVKNSVKNEALVNLKGMGSAAIQVKRKAPPSPDQALIGAILAGVIAIILYKFTITVEATLNRQTLSDNFSVRQITISIRTIINGLCYLATFVYGIPSIGLFLYSGQLAMNSFMEGSDQMQTEIKSTELLGVSNSAVKSAKEHIELSSSSKQEDQSSNNKK